MLVDNYMKIIATGCFNFMEKYPDIVNTIKTFTLFKETTTLDIVQELITRHSLQQTLSFRRELVRRAEKDAILFVQVVRYATPVRLGTRPCFHMGTDYIFIPEGCSPLRARLGPTPC